MLYLGDFSESEAREYLRRFSFLSHGDMEKLMNVVGTRPGTLSNMQYFAKEKADDPNLTPATWLSNTVAFFAKPQVQRFLGISPRFAIVGNDSKSAALRTRFLQDLARGKGSLYVFTCQPFFFSHDMIAKCVCFFLEYTVLTSADMDPLSLNEFMSRNDAHVVVFDKSTRTWTFQSPVHKACVCEAFSAK